MASSNTGVGKFNPPEKGLAIRPPTSDAKAHYNIENPPRFAKLGGSLGASTKGLKKNMLNIVVPSGSTRK